MSAPNRKDSWQLIPNLLLYLYVGMSVYDDVAAADIYCILLLSIKLHNRRKFAYL